MKTFRTKEDAALAGFALRHAHDPIWFKRIGPECPGSDETCEIENAWVLTEMERLALVTLEGVEWVGGQIPEMLEPGEEPFCPDCFAVKPGPHGSGCNLSIALKTLLGDRR